MERFIAGLGYKSYSEPRTALKDLLEWKKKNKIVPNCKPTNKLKRLERKTLIRKTAESSTGNAGGAAELHSLSGRKHCQHWNYYLSSPQICSLCSTKKAMRRPRLPQTMLGTQLACGRMCSGKNQPKCTSP